MRFLLGLLAVASLSWAQPQRQYNPFNQLCLPNMVVAGPASGIASAYPGCRALVSADLTGAQISAVNGTSQQIAAVTASGVVTLSLPSNLLLPAATTVANAANFRAALSLVASATTDTTNASNIISGTLAVARMATGYLYSNLSGAPTIVYQLVGNNGASQTARNRLNLVPGTNVTFSFADNVGTNSTDVTINSAGGGGGSVFTGSTAANPAFSATPTFSLADVSVKSPVRVEPGAMTANVTSVTFTNKTAGAKFSIVWLQDGTGGRTVSYGASANNTCAVTADANVATTQFFEVAADGATVNGVGCSDNSGLGKIVLPEGTAPSGIASSDIIYGDSVAHRVKFINNNGTADTVVGAATTDTLTNKTFDTGGTGNSLKVAGTAITAVSGTGAVCLATGSACAGGGSSTAKLPIWAGTFTASTINGGGNNNSSWWQIGGAIGFSGCTNLTGGNPPEDCEIGMNTTAGQNISYMFPWDTSYTAVDLHFVFGQSATSAGNFRFTAQLMCNTLGTSIRSGTWTLGTASTTATIVAPGTANTGIAVNITSINIPTCAATSPMVLQLVRDQTVASNDADEARLYTGSIIVTRTLP